MMTTLVEVASEVYMNARNRLWWTACSVICCRNSWEDHFHHYVDTG